MDVGVVTLHICELESGIQGNTERYRTVTEDTYGVIDSLWCYHGRLTICDCIT